ncbi:MAG: tetratricopeptide repeat protein [Caldimonas sp.]
MAGRVASIGRKVSEAVLQGRYRQALALHRQGELDAAEALYREILAAMPRSFHALHMLGVLRGQREDWAEAERLIAAAVRVDPKVAAAHANRGNALRLLRRRDDAMASYDLALRLAPDNTRALKGRGLILWESHRREEALACYERLLELEPDYADGWIMKAAVLDHLGRNDEAIACYRKALEFANVTNPDKIRYVLAAMGSEAVPAASPVEYVRDLFDKYAQRFEDHLVNLLHYRAPELLVEQLRPVLPAEPVDVLDLGCGTGLCGPLLKPWARSLTGVDLSQKMLDEARQKQVYDRLVVAEITAWLPTQGACFDPIVATDVFIYIGDLAPVFAGAHRALRSGGLFAFSTEVSEGAESRLLESLRYAHSAGYLERLAAETGWEVESVTTRVLREEDRQDVSGHLAVLRRRG